MGHKQANKNMNEIILDSGPCQEDNKLGDVMESDRVGVGRGGRRPGCHGSDSTK